jgi:hypothetical protein
MIKFHKDCIKFMTKHSLTSMQCVSISADGCNVNTTFIFDLHTDSLHVLEHKDNCLVNNYEVQL